MDVGEIEAISDNESNDSTVTVANDDARETPGEQEKHPTPNTEEELEGDKVATSGTPRGTDEGPNNIYFRDEMDALLIECEFKLRETTNKAMNDIKTTIRMQKRELEKKHEQVLAELENIRCEDSNNAERNLRRIMKDAFGDNTWDTQHSMVENDHYRPKQNVKNITCMHCSQKGHVVKDCPNTRHRDSRYNATNEYPMGPSNPYGHQYYTSSNCFNYETQRPPNRKQDNNGSYKKTTRRVTRTIGGPMDGKMPQHL